MIAHNDGSQWFGCFCDLCNEMYLAQRRLAFTVGEIYPLKGEPMKLDEIYASGSDSIKAEDLKGKDVKLTIESWKVQEFDEEGKHGPYKANKIVLSFAETDKTLVLNKTNGYAIAGFLGEDDPSKWPGASIVLYPTKTSFGTKMVDCIRIRAAEAPKGVQTPAQGKPGLTEDEVPF